MVAAPGEQSTPGERVAYVMRECGYGSNKAAFGRGAGLSPQHVNNIFKRGTLSSGSATKIATATGASFEWLLRGLGDPFPVRSIPAAPSILMVREAAQDYSPGLASSRIRNDIESLRRVTLAFLSSVTLTTPAAGAAFLEAFERQGGVWAGLGFGREATETVRATLQTLAKDQGAVQLPSTGRAVRKPRVR